LAAIWNKGRYFRFTCARCATVATFAALHLVFLESRDVVTGADSHSHLETVATWLPPRPMAHWSVLGAPIFVMDGATNWLLQRKQRVGSFRPTPGAA